MGRFTTCFLVSITVSSSPASLRMRFHMLAFLPVSVCGLSSVLRYWRVVPIFFANSPCVQPSRYSLSRTYFAISGVMSAL